MARLNLALPLTFAAVLLALAAAPGHAQQASDDPDTPAPIATMAPLPSPQPAADEPKIHKLAVQQFLAWQQGEINRALYNDNVNGQLTDDVLQSASKTLANMGALQSATFRGISHAKQGDLYVYHMLCDKGSVDMDFSLDPKGLIQAIFFN